MRIWSSTFGVASGVNLERKFDPAKQINTSSGMADNGMRIRAKQRFQNEIKAVTRVRRPVHPSTFGRDGGFITLRTFFTDADAPDNGHDQKEVEDEKVAHRDVSIISNVRRHDQPPCQ